jgi:hypothetical protein
MSKIAHFHYIQQHTLNDYKVSVFKIIKFRYDVDAIKGGRFIPKVWDHPLPSCAVQLVVLLQRKSETRVLANLQD